LTASLAPTVALLSTAHTTSRNLRPFRRGGMLGVHHPYLAHHGSGDLHVYLARDSEPRSPPSSCPHRGTNPAFLWPVDGSIQNPNSFNTMDSENSQERRTGSGVLTMRTGCSPRPLRIRPHPP
jgi:hypothetical protein